MTRAHTNRGYMKTFHKGDYKSPHVESYTIYGEGSPVLPDFGKGCMFMVDSMFCNAEPNKNKVYCENHARICGRVYGGK